MLRFPLRRAASNASFVRLLPSLGLRGLVPLLAIGAAVAVTGVAGCGDDDPPAGPGLLPDGGVARPGEDGAAPRPDDDAGLSPGADGGEDAPAPPPYPFLVEARTLDVGGASRRYVLARPRDPAATPNALVLVFHGDGDKADGLQAWWKYELATGTSAVVAYLETSTAWNHDMREDSAAGAGVPNADVDFAAAAIGELRSAYGIDASKVYGVGWSSGGFFVNVLACRRPGLLRAITVNSGGAPYDPGAAPAILTYPNGYPKCSNAQAATPAFVVHGEIDQGVPFAGGDFDAAYWAYVNGCQNQRAEQVAPCQAHAGCPAAAPVVFCPIAGMGHAIWSETAVRSYAFFQSLP